MSGWIDAGRSSVQTWECDQMGHLNVQFYVQRAEQAAAFVAHALGLGPAAAREANARLLPAQHHIRFHRELRAGAPYWLRAAPVFTDGRFIAIVAEMINTVTGETACALTGQYYWTDLNSRARLDLEDEIFAKAHALQQPMPDTALERGLSMSPPRPSASVSEAEAMGMPTTLMCEVQEAQCDARGFMQSAEIMGRLSDSIPNLLSRTTGHDRSQSDGRIGGAALEYRLIYRKAARAGDLLMIKSGLKSVGAKTYVWAHWVLNAETGEAHATAEAVAISMDLVARKAIAFPDDVRAALEGQVIAGLSL